MTETDDEGLPHRITDSDLTPATDSDFSALDDIRERQAARGVLPSERDADKRGGHPCGRGQPTAAAPMIAV